MHPLIGLGVPSSFCPSVCLSVRRTIVLHDVNPVLISPLMAPSSIACRPVTISSPISGRAAVANLYIRRLLYPRPSWRYRRRSRRRRRRCCRRRRRLTAASVRRQSMPAADLKISCIARPNNIVSIVYSWRFSVDVDAVNS